MRKSNPRFAVCVQNDGYEASLRGLDLGERWVGAIGCHRFPSAVSDLGCPVDERHSGPRGSRPEEA
jgi:hypothetical protein